MEVVEFLDMLLRVIYRIITISYTVMILLGSVAIVVEFLSIRKILNRIIKRFTKTSKERRKKL